MRVTVIGAGSIGERHIRCFLGTGRADVSFVETNEKTRDAVAGRNPAARALAELNHESDAAVIATPAPSHVPLAIKLADAGIHLLIEKPLAVSSLGIDELQKIAKEKNVTIAIAYVMRAHPALAEMKTAIDANTFGRPLQLVAVSGQNFPTYRPAYRETYYASHEQGGGAVQDALTHVINAGEWLVGPIDKLVADAAHQKLEGVEVEDTVNVLARHGNVL